MAVTSFVRQRFLKSAFDSIIPLQVQTETDMILVEAQDNLQPMVESPTMYFVSIVHFSS